MHSLDVLEIYCGTFLHLIRFLCGYNMKFGRSSKAAESAEASSPQFSSFFSAKNKEMDPTEAVASDAKGSRLFLRKKREDSNFDMMKTVNGDDDARNEKSSRNVFRRKAKEEKNKDSTETNQSRSSIFAKSNKGAEEETREGASSRSLFRKKSKDKDSSVAGNDNVRDAAEAAPVAEALATKNSSKIFSKSERSQIKVVVHSFSPDTDDIKVEKDDVPPTMDASNHVLIKVQVSHSFVTPMDQMNRTNQFLCFYRPQRSL